MSKMQGLQPSNIPISHQRSRSPASNLVVSCYVRRVLVPSSNVRSYVRFAFESRCPKCSQTEDALHSFRICLSELHQPTLQWGQQRVLREQLFPRDTHRLAGLGGEGVSKTANSGQGDHSAFGLTDTAFAARPSLHATDPPLWVGRTKLFAAM